MDSRPSPTPRPNRQPPGRELSDLLDAQVRRNQREATPKETEYITRLKNKNLSLEVSLELATDKCQMIEEQLEDAREWIGWLENDLASERKAKIKLEEQMNGEKHERAVAEADFKETIERMEGKLLAWKTKQSELAEQWDAERTQLKHEIALWRLVDKDANEKMAELKQELDLRLKDILNARRRAEEELQTTISVLQSKLKSSTSLLKTTEQQRYQWEQEIDRLNKVNEMQRVELKSAAQKQETIELQLAASRNAQWEQERADLKTEVRARRYSEEDQSEKINELMSTVTALTKKEGEWEQERSELHDEIFELKQRQEDSTALQKTNERLHEALRLALAHSHDQDGLRKLINCENMLDASPATSNSYKTQWIQERSQLNMMVKELQKKLDFSTAAQKLDEKQIARLENELKAVRLAQADSGAQINSDQQPEADRQKQIMPEASPAISNSYNFQWIRERSLLNMKVKELQKKLDFSTALQKIDEKQIAQSENELKALRLAQAESHDQINYLKYELDDYALVVANLKTEKEQCACEKRVNELQWKLETAALFEKAHAKLRRQWNCDRIQLRCEINELNEKLEVSVSREEAYSQERAPLMELMDESRKINEDHLVQLDRLKNRLDASVEAVNALAMQKAQWELERSQLKVENDKLKSGLENLPENCNLQESRLLEDLVSLANEKQEQLVSAKKTICDLKDELKAAGEGEWEQQRAQLKHTVLKLTNQLDVSQKFNRGLQVQRDRLKKRLDVSTEAEKALATQKARWELERSQLKAKIKDLRSDLTSLWESFYRQENVLNEAASFIKQQHEQSLSAKKENSDLEDELKAERITKGEFQDQIGYLKFELQESAHFHKLHGDEKVEWEQERAQLKNTVFELTERLEDSQKINVDLQVRLNHLKYKFDVSTAADKANAELNVQWNRERAQLKQRIKSLWEGKTLWEADTMKLFDGMQWKLETSKATIDAYTKLLTQLQEDNVHLHTTIFELNTQLEASAGIQEANDEQTEAQTASTDVHNTQWIRERSLLNIKIKDLQLKLKLSTALNKIDADQIAQWEQERFDLKNEVGAWRLSENQLREQVKELAHKLDNSTSSAEVAYNDQKVHWDRRSDELKAESAQWKGLALESMERFRKLQEEVKDLNSIVADYDEKMIKCQQERTQLVYDMEVVREELLKTHHHLEQTKKAVEFEQERFAEQGELVSHLFQLLHQSGTLYPTLNHHPPGQQQIQDHQLENHLDIPRQERVLASPEDRTPPEDLDDQQLIQTLFEEQFQAQFLAQ